MENFIMMYNCHHLATLKQKDSYQPEFEIIDANSDGFVTKDELLNALIRFGVDRASAEQQTNHLFETIDRNFNGVIDYSEYVMATLLSDRRVNESDL
jgi:Ca2+-binding EF-hand superfamily protein